jgi:uncharacterized protein (TIGR02453 family)
MAAPCSAFIATRGSRRTRARTRRKPASSSATSTPRISAPGYYLHLAPGDVFFGGGMYMPEPPVLAMVRTAIAADPVAWKKARDAASIKRAFGGLSEIESLTKAPRGFAPDHPMIEDIKRKSFFVTIDSSEADAGSPAFVSTVAKAYADAAPPMAYLCKAVGAKF